MSYGFEAISTYMATKQLMESVKPELDALLVYLELNDLTLEELARGLQYEDDFVCGNGNGNENENISDQVIELYEVVCDRFNELHGGREKGLHVSLAYHDYEQGSQYDDIDGMFWELREVRQYTPEAQKVHALIQPISYVVGG